MSKNRADAFRQDPRVVEAKRLLQDALRDAQKAFDGVKPAQAEAVQDYEHTLAQLGQARGGNLYFPYIGSGLGKGALVELADGSVKYDFITGIGVHYFGHSHPEIVDLTVDAALSNTVMQGHLQQNGESLELVELLVQASGMDHCFLTSSGAMANENAFKLSFQKKRGRHRLLAFDNCFAGRTWALSQVTDRPKYRDGVPETIHVDYVPFYDALDPVGSTEKAERVLKQHLERHPGQHATMIFELVQGEGGFYTGTQEFFSLLMQICRENDVTVLVDEVQTFGRTPQLFAYHHFGLEELVDIVTIGKLSQTCATLFRASFKPKVGLLSQTFTSSTTALKTAAYIVRQLLEGGYYGPEGRISAIQELFRHELSSLSARYPHWIQGPFGIGAMVAFTPLGGEPTVVTRFTRVLYELGVISFQAGSRPARARFLPPAGIVTDDDIRAVCSLIEKALVVTAQEYEIPSHQM